MNAFAPSRQTYTGAQRLEQKLAKQCSNEGDQNGALKLPGAWSDNAMGWLEGCCIALLRPDIRDEILHILLPECLKVPHHQRH